MNAAAQKMSSRNLGKESEASRIVLGRQGKPEEVAALVAFLLGNESGFITGATYSIVSMKMSDQLELKSRDNTSTIKAVNRQQR